MTPSAHLDTFARDNLPARAEWPDFLFGLRNQYALANYVVGAYRQMGPLHKYSALEPRVHHAAPLVGEHNEEVFVGELGLSPDDLASLQAAGVI